MAQSKWKKAMLNWEKVWAVDSFNPFRLHTDNVFSNENQLKKRNLFVRILSKVSAHSQPFLQQPDSP